MDVCHRSSILRVNHYTKNAYSETTNYLNFHQISDHHKHTKSFHAKWSNHTPNLDVHRSQTITNAPLSKLSAANQFQSKLHESIYDHDLYYVVTLTTNHSIHLKMEKIEANVRVTPGRTQSKRITYFSNRRQNKGPASPRRIPIILPIVIISTIFLLIWNKRKTDKANGYVSCNIFSQRR